MTIAARARAKASASPDDIAFLCPSGNHVTFAMALAEAEEVARGLLKLGIRPGDTISFQLPNWREAIAINLAAGLVGLRLNPIIPIYRSAELGMILRDAKSRLIFAPDKLRSVDHLAMFESLRPGLPDLEHIIAVRGETAGPDSYESLRASGAGHDSPDITPVDPDSPKLLLYTSGTTGRAKGVVHSHAGIDQFVGGVADYWRLDANDVMLMGSPVTHITGYGFGLELPFISDAKVVMMERWEAATAVELVQRFAVTVTVGATPFLKELLDAAEQSRCRLPSLRLFACGGASVSPDLIRRAAAVTERCRAFRVYGATEVPMVTKGFIGSSEIALASETDGRVVDYEVRVIDSAGRALPRGAPGELCVKGPAMMRGYTDSGETAKAIAGDGYFHTGDLGILTDDDAIVVTGRLKDIIIRGGENLSPTEIEIALEQHPAIEEAAVVAMPHARLGEGVAAFLRSRPGAVPPGIEEIAAFLDRKGLARQKFPERIDYLDDLPRTASGKVRKDQLRALLCEPATDPAVN